MYIIDQTTMNDAARQMALCADSGEVRAVVGKVQQKKTARR